MESAVVSTSVCYPGSKQEYSVLVGYGLLQHLGKDVLSLTRAGHVVIISDTTVWRLYGDVVLSSFPDDKPPLHRAIPPGELAKTRDTKAQLEDWMLASGCHRDTVVVAVGGGVVGDLAGFVAATFMRGVPVVQVPTTVLAMVDSAIGGKTGLDTPAGKNLVGAFHQPKRVYVDLSVLSTLPKREFVNGMGEVIKAGAISNRSLFNVLEEGVDLLLEQPDTPQYYDLLQTVVTASIEVKVGVVTQDEREKGLRATLNFGHTIGHGVERVMQPAMLHGECVAVGMVKEAEVARAMRVCDPAVVGRLVKTLKAYGLPVRLPAKAHADDVMAGMVVDKKNATVDGVLQVKCVLLKDIGEVVTEPACAHSIAIPLLRRVIAKAVTVQAPSAPLSSLPPVSIRVPGSKSLSNRMLLLAALSAGTVRLHGLLQSDDTQVMLTALSRLGAGFAWEREPSTGPVLVVRGTKGELQYPATSDPFYLGNAGTASRFLTTVLCLLPDSSKSVVLTGNARMQQRPIGPLVDALRRQGCRIEYMKGEGCPPLRIFGGGLSGGVIELKAQLSSQYVSSVLMSAPLAHAPVELKLAEEKPTSLPYILMTLRTMETFGVRVEQHADNHFTIGNRAGYLASSEGVFVEPDASSATYPAAIAAVTGRTVTLQGVGSTSSQGDAGFATLLEKMGCAVVQTDTDTTVTGPPAGGLKGLTVDMGDLTDAFLTLAVVAAVANGPTAITGIANQRVKECNRIEAMATELAKCKVSASELPDGIRVAGTHGAAPPAGATIHCYDDHRVAMAFAVLGCVVPGVVLDDPLCVEKTYPQFWDDLENVFGFTVTAADEPRTSAGTALGGASSAAADTASTPAGTASGAGAGAGAGTGAGAGAGVGAGAGADISTVKHPSGAAGAALDRDMSVVIIGMRGAGKSSCGRAAAAVLGWEFVDLDAAVEQTAGQRISEMVADKGWEAFRELELQTLLATTDAHPTRTIITCGGGIVETPAARTHLKTLPLVVAIQRNIEDIVLDIEGVLDDASRPAYANGDTLHATWARRQPWLYECSTHEFFIRQGDRNWPMVSAEFAWFLDKIGVGRDAPFQVSLGAGTFFLSLTFPDITSIPAHHVRTPTAGRGAEAGGETPEAVEARCVDLLKRAAVGVDAVELRVDLLASQQPEFVMDQLAFLRRHLPNHAVVYTVRSRVEGGAFDGSDDAMFKLLQLGLRCGCEYVDVESRLPATSREHLIAHKRLSKIIASTHYPSPPQPSIADLSAELQRSYQGGGADVLKIVSRASTSDDVVDMQRAVAAAREALDVPDLPVIALCMGAEGQLSRVLNTVLTPVTHSLLPAAAAPGQLTAAAIQEARLQFGMLPTKRYYLFGHPISTSPSPLLHNTGFSELSLPHNYSLMDTTNIAAVVRVLRDSSTGGGSVTIPHKQSIVSYLQHLSPSASAIGAVNTVKRIADGELYGDNTDWLGMYGPLSRCLRQRTGLVPPSSDPPSALVIGAGGTAAAAAYCVQRLGLQLFVYNRTLSKAEHLAKRFGGTAVADLNDDPLPCLDAILSTVPATARLEVPDFLLDSRPVVLDAAYRPRITLLLAQARARECLCVEGIDMLLEQGLRQFEIWTGRVAPAARITAVVHAHYDRTAASTDTTPLRGDTSPKLSVLETQLADVDLKVQKLLQARAQCVSQLVDLKGVSTDTGVSEVARARVPVDADSGLAPDSVNAIFREIVSASVAVCNSGSVVYVGPRGSFAHQATVTRFGRSIPQRPLDSIEAVLLAVSRGRSSFGVVPIEHSLNGVDRTTLGTLMSMSDTLHICGEEYVPVTHCFMAPAAVRAEDIRVVFATEEVVLHCRRWCERRLGDVDLRVSTTSAAAAQEAASTGNAGAIAPALAAEEYGLAILEAGVEDGTTASLTSGAGTTRFIVIAARHTFNDEDAEGDAVAAGVPFKTATVVDLAKDKAGALHTVTGAFASRGISMTKIESFPGTSNPGSRGFAYHFFIEFQGHRSNDAVLEALVEVRSCATVKVLGSFKQASA